MDLDRFRSSRSRGIFEGDGEGYARWSAWAEGITGAVRASVARNALSAKPVHRADLEPIVGACMADPESAIHVVVGDMTRSGTTWMHLALLRELARVVDVPYPDVSDVAGRFLPQTIRSLAWYEDLRDGPAPSVVVERDVPRHEVRADNESTVYLSRVGDSLRLEIFMDGRGAAVTLDRATAEDFVAKVSGIVPEGTRGTRKGSASFGTGDRHDGTFEGLSVTSSSQGDPYLAVLDFSIEATNWETLRYAELQGYKVEELLRAARGMLDASPSVGPEAPSGPR